MGQTDKRPLSTGELRPSSVSEYQILMVRSCQSTGLRTVDMVKESENHQHISYMYNNEVYQMCQTLATPMSISYIYIF